jgi:hypothetical protein
VSKLRAWAQLHGRLFAGLGLITIFGLAIRFRNLGLKPIWDDEAALWLEALGVNAATADPWLPRHLVRLWMWVCSDTSFEALHFLPALFGGLAVFFVGLAARELALRQGFYKEATRIAWLSAYIASVLPLAVTYSREARPYGFLMLGTALLYWSFLRLWAAPTNRNYVYYAVAVLFSTLSHYNSVHILGAFFIALCFQARAGREYSQLTKFLLVTCICSLPTVFTTRFTYALATLEPQPIVSIWRYLYAMVLPFGMRTMRDGNYLTWPDCLMVLVAFAGLWLLYKSTRRNEAYLFTWGFLVPLTLTYVFLGSKASWSGIRYLSHLSVPYSILVAVALHRFGNAWGKWAYAVVVVFCLALIPLKDPGTRVWNNYPQSAQYLRSQAGIAGVIGRGDRTVNSFGYYYWGPVPIYTYTGFEIMQLWKSELQWAPAGLRKLWIRRKHVTELLPGKYLVLNEGWESKAEFCRVFGGQPEEIPTVNLGVCRIEARKAL